MMKGRKREFNLPEPHRFIPHNSYQCAAVKFYVSAKLLMTFRPAPEILEQAYKGEMRGRRVLRVLYVCPCVSPCVFFGGDYGTRAHHFLPSWFNVIRFWQATPPFPSLGSWSFLFSFFSFFCLFTWGIRRRLEQEVILLPFAFSPGVATFFDVWGFTVIYRLRLWPVPGPAGLLFSLADTSRCWEPVALCLPSHYRSQPTFPFGTEH